MSEKIKIQSNVDKDLLVDSIYSVIGLFERKQIIEWESDHSVSNLFQAQIDQLRAYMKHINNIPEEGFEIEIKIKPIK